jgi:hypothetical protein
MLPCKKELANGNAICYNGVIMTKKYCRMHILVITIALLITIGDVAAGTVLEDILKTAGNARREGNLPIVIFDLDGTLFHTGFRSKQIFLEFAMAHGDSILVNKVNAIDPISMKYRVRKTLITSGITDSTVLKAMIDSWRVKFFSDDYLKYDEQLAGSVKFVSALHDSGTLIIYLTGRDASGMLLGTTASLTERGFPVGIARTELIMKPERYMKTYSFKKQSLPYIEQLGKVVAVFENEPEYLNLLSEHFPYAKACFVETQHKPNAPAVTENAHHISHFVINLPLKPTGEYTPKTN